jgi:S-formylglutathione hydrolase FrmB
MYRFRRALLRIGLSGAGLLLLSVAIAGCAGASGATTISQHQPSQHLKPGPAPVASAAFAGLPGRDVSKARDGGGDLRSVQFFSPSLGREDSYLIYLPAGYSKAAAAGRQFRVLYLLHGDGRHQRHGAGHMFQRGRIANAANALAASRAGPMLTVIPESADGTVVGDTEWANTSRGQFESVVLDAVHAVDSTWPTIPNRSARAIAGLSMGGFGAVNVALHHPDVFSVIESWSGYFTQTPIGPFAGASRKTLDANSPAKYVSSLASRLAADPMHVLLYSSPTDKLHVQQAPFASKLRSLRVPVETRLFGGPHNYALWSTQMGLALQFADRWLTG